MMIIVLFMLIFSIDWIRNVRLLFLRYQMMVHRENHLTFIILCVRTWRWISYTAHFTWLSYKGTLFEGFLSVE